MRSIDWGATPLGPVDRWSRWLCSTVSLLLHNQSALLLWWGPRYVQLYNDAYRPVLGDKHPRSMGQLAGDCWSEIWHIIGPMVDQPFRGGPATTSDDLFLFINRRGFVEETHFRVAYSPVPDPTIEPTGIGGVLATVAETTEQVHGERQLRTLRELAARGTATRSVDPACTTAAAALGANPWDVPFAQIYLFDSEGADARLAASAGFSANGLARNLASFWPLRQAAEGRRAHVVDDLASLEQALPPSPHGERPRSAIVLPLASPDQPAAYGALVCGVSPHRVLDEGYRTFFELAALQVATTIRDAHAFETERRRAEELQALDRAKTTFFSNVSHELRTPLTLIMGPTDDALRSPEQALKGDALRLVQRNELRLLKLVNSLLDFARMEAGRTEASFQRTDLATFTREVASAFSLAIETAGLELVVDCEPLPRPTYVDRGLWEKVVLNLVPNALKFTFEGRITVKLRASGEVAELQVGDTGTGIPAAELPHVFERFRRVPGGRSRTHEGAGIGLALVSEIVKMHGGTVVARSVVGEGTTFTVRIPFGKAHLDPARVERVSEQASTALGAGPFVAEALRWLPGAAFETAGDEGSAPAVAVPAEISGARIIVADDNADMREYVTRLLSPSWRVEAVSNGGAALAAARRQRPDLVLTDVMMPILDGFGLLRELRADPSLASTPVLMLSARAGEEASVEGLSAGADDYLVKPFSSRELLARVSTHLQLRRSREHLELALEGADAAAWDWDLKSGDFSHNARWAELRGYGVGELPLRVETLFLGVHPEDLPRMQQTLKDHFDGRRPMYAAELRVETKDGRWIWISQRGKVLARDEQGRPLRMAGTSVDITSRKRAEMQQRFLAELGPFLHHSLDVERALCALSERIVKHLADYCVIDLVGEDGEIRRARVSSSLEEKKDVADELARLPLGGQRSPVLLQVLRGGAKLLFETVVSADLEEWARNREHLRLLNETGVRSLLWVPLVGRDRILGGLCLASATPDRQYSAEDVRFAEELARRASLSLENAALYRAAERAIAARDEVLAVVAHDLRNPLSTVTMQARLLKNRAEPEGRVQQASERIERAAARMNRLIQDLLDVTRAEAGQLSLDRAELRARDVAADVLEAEKTLAAASSIELQLSVTEQLPNIFADRHRLLQVFENLIGNALKFTRPGGRITVGLVPQAGAVLCYVRDTGEGIPADEVAHLFDRFWQSRRSRDEKRAGAGLGLPIVKGIVEAHGGRIWAESAPGEGSTFYFTIPTTASDERARAGVERESPSS
jgi:PAS domain S-box-containing protein